MTERETVERAADRERASRVTPTSKLTALEWRLWLIAALAGAYALVWLALVPDVTAPPLAPQARLVLAPPPTAPLARPPRDVVWLAELPTDQRPVVVLPDGWTLSDSTPRVDARVAVSTLAMRVAASTLAPRVASNTLASAPPSYTAPLQRPAPRFVQATRTRMRVRTRSS